MTNTAGAAPTSPRGLGLEPVEHQSRKDVVMQQIRRAVTRGDLPPGRKLTEQALSSSLGVSRPTIREALAQLAQEGLLVQEPYRGLRVAELDAEEIMDIAWTRHALDRLACAEILADASGARMQKVRRAWAEFERWEFSEDPLVRHEAHLEFHRALWAASENSMLLRYWPITAANLTISLAQDQAVRSDPVRASVVHQHLIDALESGDLVKAEAAFHEHTIDSARELVQLIGAGQP